MKDESHLPVSEQSLVFRLRKRAEIRRQIKDRKSVQEGTADRIADLLEEAADEIDMLNLKTSSVNNSLTLGNSVASIKVVADPDGAVSKNTVPGKIQFLTTGDDGVQRLRFDVDKGGRVVSYGQIWATTASPTGMPLYALSNSDVTSTGAKVALRRSRGTYNAPTSVTSGDSLFRLLWGGHDGTNYRDTAGIEANVSGNVSLGIIPTDLTVKTTNVNGVLTTAAKFTVDQTFQVDKISSLSGDTICFQSNIAGNLLGSVYANTSYKVIDGSNGSITTPSLTASHYVKFPIYNNIEDRDTVLPSPKAGMTILMVNEKHSISMQVNVDGTKEGWVDLKSLC
jgi:hypothetical protein